jgi:hypothetical protein
VAVYALWGPPTPQTGPLARAGSAVGAGSALNPDAAGSSKFGVATPSFMFGPAVRELQRQVPSGQSLYAWPLSQRVYATLLSAEWAPPSARAAYGRAVLRLWQDYWCGNTACVSPGSDQRYTDDAGWVGLGLLKIYEQTGNPAALFHARQINTFLKSCEDRNPHQAYCGNTVATVYPGGEYWLFGTGLRSTVSTLVAALLALELNSINPSDVSDLSYAMNLRYWVQSTMLRSDGLPGDNITTSGARNMSFSPDDAGLYIGVDRLLYMRTGEAAYLADATRMAMAAIKYERAHALSSQALIRLAIFLDNLVLLNSVAPNAAFTSFLDYCAQWVTVRTDAAGKFHEPHAPSGGGPSNKQSAAVIILGSYKLSRMSPSGITKLESYRLSQTSLSGIKALRFGE